MKKIIIPVLFTLLVATILTAIKASSKGSSLVSLENKASNLAEANKELKDKIVSSSSLTQIQKNAGSLGMQAPEKFIYMTNQGIALR